MTFVELVAFLDSCHDRLVEVAAGLSMRDVTSGRGVSGSPVRDVFTAVGRDAEQRISILRESQLASARANSFNGLPDWSQLSAGEVVSRSLAADAELFVAARQNSQGSLELGLRREAPDDQLEKILGDRLDVVVSAIRDLQPLAGEISPWRDEPFLATLVDNPSR